MFTVSTLSEFLESIVAVSEDDIISFSEDITVDSPIKCIINLPKFTVDLCGHTLDIQVTDGFKVNKGCDVTLIHGNVVGSTGPLFQLIGTEDRKSKLTLGNELVITSDNTVISCQKQSKVLFDGVAVNYSGSDPCIIASGKNSVIDIVSGTIIGDFDCAVECLNGSHLELGGKSLISSEVSSGGYLISIKDIGSSCRTSGEVQIKSKSNGCMVVSSGGVAELDSGYLVSESSDFPAVLIFGTGSTVNNIGSVILSMQYPACIYMQGESDEDINFFNMAGTSLYSSDQCIVEDNRGTHVVNLQSGSFLVNLDDRYIPEGMELVDGNLISSDYYDDDYSDPIIDDPDTPDPDIPDPDIPDPDVDPVILVGSYKLQNLALLYIAPNTRSYCFEYLGPVYVEDTKLYGDPRCGITYVKVKVKLLGRGGTVHGYIPINSL